MSENQGEENKQTSQKAQEENKNQQINTLGDDGMPVMHQEISWGQQKEKIMTQEDIKEIMKQQNILKLQEQLKNPYIDHFQKKYIINQIKLTQKHQFWDTQPVKKYGWETPEKDGPIEIKTVDQVQKEPLQLPAGFEWFVLDLNDDQQANQLFILLRDHYVEDSGGNFRFEYPIPLLKWMLLGPGYKQEWHLGLRAIKDQKLLGFISGTPCKIIVNGQVIKMAEINLLCVHKKLRDKKMTPTLIKEITRRIQLQNIWQAYYTSGSTFPYPFTHAQYFHRTLQPKKNVETGFSILAKNDTLARYVKKHKLPELKPGLIVGEPRLMQSKDVSQVYALYKKQSQKYDVTFKFSQDEIAHHLLPQDGIIYTIVIENNGKITDFVSFYNLPSQILKQEGHNHTRMNVAYLYYWATGEENNITNLMHFVLHYAKDMCPDGTKFDVFNCLNIMENMKFLDECKFGVGDGILNFYMYNYQISTNRGVVPSEKVGTVLV